MIGIKMKPNIPVHYQKGNTLQKGNLPLPPPPPNFYFYFICTKIGLQENIMHPPPLLKNNNNNNFICTKIVLQEKKDYTPLIIFTNLANIFAYNMTIIVRSMYNFVNCLQFNIRYEKVEHPAPVGGALV